MTITYLVVDHLLTQEIAHPVEQIADLDPPVSCQCCLTVDFQVPTAGGAVHHCLRGSDLAGEEVTYEQN